MPPKVEEPLNQWPKNKVGKTDVIEDHMKCQEA